jgi:hypothetical protein
MTDWLSRSIQDPLWLCENLCEKSFPKCDKMAKNQKRLGMGKLCI